MNQTTRIIVVMLCAGLPSLFVSCQTQGDPPPNACAVIVRAAGVLPGQDKLQNSDAVTHATPKVMNTYVFSEELAKSLAELKVETRIVDFSECRNLECLRLQPLTDNPQRVDILVFAGPAFSSKLPDQLQVLFPKLGGIAKATPDLVCSSLISAWFPETKGIQATEHANRAFMDAGLQTVKGISLLTPHGKKPGITQRGLEKAVADFAAQLVAKAGACSTSAETRHRKCCQPLPLQPN